MKLTREKCEDLLNNINRKDNNEGDDSRENNSQENSSEENSSQKNSSEKNSNQNNSSEKNSSEKNSSEKNSSEKNSSEKNSNQNNSSEKNSNEKNSSEEDSSEKNSSEKNSSEENSSEKNSNQNNSSEKNSSEENSSEENSSQKNSSEKNSNQDNSSEKNSNEKNSSEKNSSEKNSNQNNSSEKNSSEKNSSEKNSSEENSSEKDSSEENNNEKGIKGVVQGRAKKYKSLKKKLEDLKEHRNKDPEEYDWLKQKVEVMEKIPEKGSKEYNFLKKRLIELEEDRNAVHSLRDWVLEDRNIYEHPEMGDLAGVRIGLYFPDDVVKVVEEIRKCFNVQHYFGTVSGGRDVTKGRNLDISKHLHGPWLDGDNDHWEHYGYKSWQMVVEWKEPPREDLKSLRVEIQVGTVVTQAWAEVQHNVIYKKPTDILTTPTMKRIIDAINGLAITTDIMLKELGRSLEDAEKEEEALGSETILNGRKFVDWFESRILSLRPPEESERWVCCWRRADDMLGQWESRSFPGERTFPRNCRADIKKVIEKQRLLYTETKSDQELDISVLLSRILDFEIHDACGYCGGCERNRNWKFPSYGYCDSSWDL